MNTRTSLRPPISVEKQLQLVLALSIPLHRVTACHQIGISPTTFANWLTRGRRLRDGKIEKPSPFDRWCLRLLIDVERAEGDAEENLANSLLRAANDDWRAAAHYMACRWPERWSKSESRRVEVTNHDAPADEADPQEQLTKLLALPDVADAIEKAAFEQLDERVETTPEPSGNGKSNGTPHA